MLSILLCQVVLVLSPASGMGRDAGVGGPNPLLGRASPGRTVAEVLDVNACAHPPSRLGTGPLWPYVVKNVVQHAQHALCISYFAYTDVMCSMLCSVYALTDFVGKTWSPLLYM